MYLRETVTGGYTAAYHTLRISCFAFSPTTLWLNDSGERCQQGEHASKPQREGAHISLCNTVFIFKKHRYQMIIDNFGLWIKVVLRRKTFFPKEKSCRIWCQESSNSLYSPLVNVIVKNLQPIAVSDCRADKLFAFTIIPTFFGNPSALKNKHSPVHFSWPFLMIWGQSVAVNRLPLQCQQLKPHLLQNMSQAGWRGEAWYVNNWRRNKTHFSSIPSLSRANKGSSDGHGSGELKMRKVYCLVREARTQNIHLHVFDANGVFISPKLKALDRI